jgi:methyl-accepting chemotaxis protein
VHESVGQLFERLSEPESKKLLEEYLLQFNNLVEATSKIGFDPKSGKQGEMRNSVREMETMLKKEVVRLNTYVNEYVDSAQLSHLIFVIAISILIGLIVIVIAKQSITPLQVFSNRISEIRQNNDLSQRTEEREDEIGAISKEFNIFMAHFQSLIKSINQTVDSLSESTNVVSKSVNKTSEGLQNQALESDMVATAVTEMGVTASEIANNAHATKEKTDEASIKVGTGKERLDNTVLNINQLSNDLVIAEKEILNLEEKSNGITSVLEVIKGIAEQTNLLALNAAIEAARAGEQGRGFAVVADEVRTLAVRTQDSTSEITTIINELQTTTSGIVKTMNHCKERGLSSVSQAQDTELVLNEIILNVEDIADMTVQVATAVEEQSAVVQDVDRNIVRIRDIGEQVASDSQENARASQDVANLAKELHKEANIFSV